MEIAASLFFGIKLYALAGALVAALFLLFGLTRVTPEARGSWAFRPLLAPGLVLLWPLVLWRWQKRARGVDEARAAAAPDVQHAQRVTHLRSWLALAVLLPLVLWLALSVLQDRAALQAPQRLEAPGATP